MKRIFTLLIFCMAVWTAQAQLSDGTKAPEITITDQEGDVHVLYDYLNQGKTVVIDIFATWCGPCWTLHQNQVLENLYQEYGPDGTDEIMVFSIEGDATTSHQDLLGPSANSWGNWLEGISFPIVEDESIPDLFGLNFWPTIYLIRPNGNMILANDYCWANLLEPSQDWVYNLATRGPNDILANNTQTDRILCGSTAYTGATQIKNMGTAPLTSAMVDMLFNGEVVQTKSWTGNLAEFKTANVSFTPMPLSETTEITYYAYAPNGETDEYLYDNHDTVRYSFPVATTPVEFSITTDFWPEEISWELQDPSGNVLYSNEDLGPLSCDQTYTQTFVLAAEGCHRFIISDAYGDGLLNSPVNPGSHNCMTPNGMESMAMGAISLVVDGVVIFDNISYGDGTQVTFDADMSSGVQPIENLESAEIYPNPAQAFVDLQLNLSQPTDLMVEVVDITGKTLIQQESRTFAAGAHTEQIDVAHLVNGTYFVRLTEKNKVNTLKFAVVN